jgi:hypothetical protein
MGEDDVLAETFPPGAEQLDRRGMRPGILDHPGGESAAEKSPNLAFSAP